MSKKYTDSYLWFKDHINDVTASKSPGPLDSYDIFVDGIKVGGWYKGGLVLDWEVAESTTAPARLREEIQCVAFEAVMKEKERLNEVRKDGFLAIINGEV